MYYENNRYHYDAGWVSQYSALDRKPLQEVSSKIAQVTVFLEGAQITRSSSVNLKQGVSNLSLNGNCRGYPGTEYSGRWSFVGENSVCLVSRELLRQCS